MGFRTLTACVALAFVMIGCGGEEQQQGGPRDTFVKTTTPNVRPLEVTARSVGTVTARESVEVTAERAGKIEEVFFTEGNRVEAGELLVRLDDTEFQAEVEELRQQLANAKADLWRGEELLEAGAIARSEVQNRRTEVETLQDRIDAAQKRAEDLTIRAPFSGVLGLRRVSPGSLVEPGGIVTSLATIDPIEVQFDVSTEYLSALLEGDRKVYATTGAWENRTFEGRVDTVDNLVNPQTRTVAAEAVFPNEDRSLRPGMFVSIEVVVDQDDSALMIPEEALVLRGDAEFVYLMQEGKATRQDVETGFRTDSEVQILEGLSEDDEVIVSGIQNLREGAPVTTERPGGEEGGNQARSEQEASGEGESSGQSGSQQRGGNGGGGQ